MPSGSFSPNNTDFIVLHTDILPANQSLTGWCGLQFDGQPLASQLVGHGELVLGARGGLENQYYQSFAHSWFGFGIFVPFTYPPASANNLIVTMTLWPNKTLIGKNLSWFWGVPYP